MDESLEKELVNKYPSLFGYYNEEFDGPAPQISLFGFECGDGWYDIIDSLCETITEQDIDLKVVQVKEKFGGLRFYYGEVEVEDERKGDLLHGAVRMACNMSFRVCESCGSPGEHRDDGGWYKTRCDDCYESSSSDSS